MRLLILIHSLFSGGAERVTASLANHWAYKGWKVTIVTFAGKGKYFYTLHPKIQRIALGLDKQSSNPVSASWFNLQRILSLRVVLKRELPDVALAMMSTANCLLAISSIGTGIVAVGSERTYPPMMPLGRTWEWIRRVTYSRLAAVVTQTEQSAKWLEINTLTRKAPVIPNPVTYPLDSHEPYVNPPTSGMEGGRTHCLLAVGRLDSNKSFDIIISVFAELAPHFSEWNLAIVGEGPHRTELESQVVDSGLERRIHLPGNVGNIGKWYEAADLFVMTSRFEGFPNALLEALAHGVPVVSVDCETGPREIIRQAYDGLLVAPNDRSELLNALKRLMADKSLRRRYSERAKEVRKRFSMEKIAGMWEQLFKKVTERT